MSKDKKQSKQRIRPLVLALSLIAVSVLALTLINRNDSAANGERRASTTEASDYTREDAAGKVQILTAANFEGMVSEGVVLVDFWATWCPPCRIQGPIVEELAMEMGDQAVISKLDVDDHGNIAALFQVRSIPTLIIFRDGEPVRRFVGVQQKETLAQAIRELL